MPPKIPQNCMTFHPFVKNRSTIIGDIMIYFDVAKIKPLSYSCNIKTDLNRSFTFLNELVLKYKKNIWSH